MTDFSEVLENDLSWREAELASLKKTAILSKDNEDLYTSILRACWALLYAHFEGFTKFAWDLLLDQVQHQNVEVNKLTEEFQLLALEKKFSILKKDLSPLSLMNFYRTQLPDALKASASFHSDHRLQTESNLWPNVFERECARIGITLQELDSSRMRIKALVSRRNEIAHGKNMTIDSVNEYSEYEHATFLILHELAITVLELIDKKTYINATVAVNS